MHCNIQFYVAELTCTDYRLVHASSSDSFFQESQIHPALKDLLETAGIKTTALKDEGTAEFIKTFVENNGGMDTLVKEKQRRATIRGSASS